MFAKILKESSNYIIYTTKPSSIHLICIYQKRIILTLVLQELTSFIIYLYKNRVIWNVFQSANSGN